MWFTQFWEFGPHTWGAINYKGVQSFGQQIEGVALTENWCTADFQRPGIQSPNFGLCQDAENQRDIDFYSAQAPQTVVHSLITSNTSSAPKYGGRTPSKTYLACPPVFVHKHRNWGFVHNHVFGCQIRSTGSSGPIFWVQSYREAYLCIVYQSGECDR